MIIQWLNIKECKILDLQIAQIWHPLRISDGKKMSKFNTL